MVSLGQSDLKVTWHFALCANPWKRGTAKSVDSRSGFLVTWCNGKRQRLTSTNCIQHIMKWPCNNRSFPLFTGSYTECWTYLVRILFAKKFTSEQGKNATNASKTFHSPVMGSKLLTIHWQIHLIDFNAITFRWASSLQETSYNNLVPIAVWECWRIETPYCRLQRE